MLLEKNIAELNLAVSFELSVQKQLFNERELIKMNRKLKKSRKQMQIDKQKNIYIESSGFDKFCYPYRTILEQFYSIHLFNLIYHHVILKCFKK